MGNTHLIFRNCAFFLNFLGILKKKKKKEFALKDPIILKFRLYWEIPWHPPAVILIFARTKMFDFKRIRRKEREKKYIKLIWRYRWNSDHIEMVCMGSVWVRNSVETAAMLDWFAIHLFRQSGGASVFAYRFEKHQSICWILVQLNTALWLILHLIAWFVH